MQSNPLKLCSKVKLKHRFIQYRLFFFFFFFGHISIAIILGNMIDFSYMYDTRHWLPPPTYVCTGPILSRSKEMSEHVDHPFPCSDRYGRHKTDCHLRIETIITKKFVSSKFAVLSILQAVFFL